MEMSGFTEEQLTVRDAIQKICAQFTNEYWQQHDQTETDPKELHAALAADGWREVRFSDLRIGRVFTSALRTVAGPVG